jgi:thiamine pyrophosphate-dependent acetolactate synthase large subunit-like protein
MAQMTGEQALVESLIREGVNTIFGLPGVQLDWAFDALHAAQDSISVVHTRHEELNAAQPQAALGLALREALTHDGPVMIEVPVGPMPSYQRGLRERVAERLAQTA